MRGMTARFELFVEDVKRSIEFYTDVLGFIELSRGPDYHSVQRDGIIIGIEPASGLSKNHYFRPEVTHSRKGIGVEIVFEVDDITTEYKKVQASGYRVAEKLTKREWGLTDFRIADPDGYYIRLTSRS